MKNDRLRSAVKSDYVEALGRATYCFASCEWQVAWCSEHIKPGSLDKIAREEMTAGTIAKRFKDICRNMPPSKEREELQQLADTFLALVGVRNDILHGKPCTGPNGESRLSGTKVHEIGNLEDAADAFSECGAGLNQLSYGYLQRKSTP